MTNAAQQNAMMLASILRIAEADASERLARTVLVTAEPGWKSTWAEELTALVSRTVMVTVVEGGTAHLEIVVGATNPRSKARKLYVDIGAAHAVVSDQPIPAQFGRPHALYAQAAACAAAAAAVHGAIDDLALPPVRLPMQLDFDQLGVPAGALDRAIELRSAVMAGAGRWPMASCAPPGTWTFAES